MKNSEKPQDVEGTAEHSRRQLLAVAGLSIVPLSGCLSGETHAVEVVDVEGKEVIRDISPTWTTVHHKEHSHHRKGVKVVMAGAASDLSIVKAYAYYDGKVLSQKSLKPTQTSVSLALLRAEGDVEHSDTSFTYTLRFTDGSNNVVSKATVKMEEK